MSVTTVEELDLLWYQSSSLSMFTNCHHLPRCEWTWLPRLVFPARVLDNLIICRHFIKVMSESVGKALEMVGWPEASGTVKFVLMFDKFFHSLNVGDFHSSQYHRKPFQAPYYSSNDFRLTVSAFLNYKHVHVIYIYFSLVAGN